MESLPELLQLPSMSPETIATIQAQCGILVCISVPPGTQIGLDHAEWRVGARFTGVRFVPPGAHFLWARYDDVARGWFIVRPPWPRVTGPLTVPCWSASASVLQF